MTAAFPDSLSGHARRLRARAKRPSQRVLAVLAVLALLLGACWALLDDGSPVEMAALIAVMVVLSSLALGQRAMLALLVTAALCLGLVVLAHGPDPAQLSESGLVMVAVTALVALIQARRRDRLGLRQVSAETVLGLIRDRLLVQAQLPPVPAGWTVVAGRSGGRPAQASLSHARRWHAGRWHASHQPSRTGVSTGSS
ncbi:MAG TPA: hypothetical protein VF557_09555 [Jatrophihabitans sp.]|jgi:hypothetical protein|uniref:hypothetical protein n=1 Tax=Jatrophihabitans sp. TaxID=1932789 RepID=UPI002EDC8F06